MKSKLLILVGPPLSGKDTYLKSIDLTTYTSISRDDILMSLHNNNDYTEAFHSVNPKEVDRKLNDLIESTSNNKGNVVINMTNLSKKSRKRHLSKFKSNEYEKIAIVFPKLKLEEYMERNNRRLKEENKFIPQNVILSMITSWEDVTTDEGFDKIIKL